MLDHIVSGAQAYQYIWGLVEVSAYIEERYTVVYSVSEEYLGKCWRWAFRCLFREDIQDHQSVSHALLLIIQASGEEVEIDA